MKLSELAEALGGRLVGDGTIEVVRPVSPAAAEHATDLVLAMQPDALALLAGSKARAAIVAEGTSLPDGLVDGWIVIGRPRYAMAGVTAAFATPPQVHPGIHPSAVIDDSARIGDGVSVGPLTVIGAAAQIGAGTMLMSQVTVGAAATIGRDCLLHPGVRIGERVIVGDRVIVHHNASIGADGFSFVTPEPGSVEAAKTTGRVAATNTDIVRIASIGTVILGDDVEIGACSAIDRATIDATTIGRNTKIDDLVLIGHNCTIGENCLLCGQVGVAGSTRIGDRCVLGGQVGVADHLTLGEDSVIAARAAVAQDAPPRSVLLGTPAVPRQRAFEQFRHIGRLKSLFANVRDLTQRIKALEAKGRMTDDDGTG
jgi:UDP-3-O-[3-hydroxymyristoyl] glucosamine N-acyltransferase